MKISAIIYGFFFAVIYSVVDKPKSTILLFAGILLALVAAEKFVETIFSRAENRLPVAKALICYAAFVTLRLLGLEGIYKSSIDILMAFIFAVIPALLVYFIVRYQMTHQKY